MRTIILKTRTENRLATKCDNCPRERLFNDNCKNQALPQFSLEVLQEDLLSAIKDFYNNDFELLDRNVHEICIVSHIYHYFAMRFVNKYSGYHIDMEYNRNGRGAKYYCRNNYAIPDLIIHKRNCNLFNLLYAEFKANRKNHSEHDIEKLQRFISDSFGEENGHLVEPYRFKYGVSILLNRGNVDFLWYCSNDYNTPVRTTICTSSWTPTICFEADRM